MAAQMTNPTGSRGLDATGVVTRIVAEARRIWRRHVTYRDTQAQLNRLSIREREDIGIAGEDLDAIAYDAASRITR